MSRELFLTSLMCALFVLSTSMLFAALLISESAWALVGAGCVVMSAWMSADLIVSEIKDSRSHIMIG